MIDTATRALGWVFDELLATGGDSLCFLVDDNQIQYSIRNQMEWIGSERTIAADDYRTLLAALCRTSEVRRADLGYQSGEASFVYRERVFHLRIIVFPEVAANRPAEMVVRSVAWTHRERDERISIPVVA